MPNVLSNVSSNQEVPIFPQGFMFGVSTAACQIEADIPDCNWHMWSHQTKEDGTPRAPVDNRKCDAINRFPQDVEIMKSLGVNVYRFSVCWSRINPNQGVFNEEAIQMYRNWCIYLKSNGIEPMVTLWHFEHPAWIEQRGSVKGPEFVPRFADFCERVVSQLHDVCSIFHTLNEPIGFAVSSYLAGIHPPGAGSITDFCDAMANLFKAHVAAYQIIKRYNPSAMVSYAKNVVAFVPMHSWSLLEHIAAYYMNHYTRIGFKPFEKGYFRFLWQKREIPGIINTLDFISVNHYYCGFVTLNCNEWSVVEGNKMPFLSYGENFVPTSDFGWGLITSSLASVMQWINDQSNPRKLKMMISEHGLADNTDSRRQWFLQESLFHLSRAVSMGLPLMGYIHWTLYDNYEWAEGTRMKFGLFETNFETMDRKPRESAKLYSNIIAAQFNQ